MFRVGVPWVGRRGGILVVVGWGIIVLGLMMCWVGKRGGGLVVSGWGWVVSGAVDRVIGSLVRSCFGRR